MFARTVTFVSSVIAALSACEKAIVGEKMTAAIMAVKTCGSFIVQEVVRVWGPECSLIVLNGVHRHQLSVFRHIDLDWYVRFVTEFGTARSIVSKDFHS